MKDMEIESFVLTEKEEKYLKSLLGIAEDDTSKDINIKFSLEDAYETIQNYCHTEGVNKGLYNTMFRMAIDLYRNENIGSEESSMGVVSSISEGDTTVSYKNPASDFKESLLKNYKIQLTRYRKIEW